MMLSRLKTSLKRTPGRSIDGGAQSKHAAVALVIRPNLDLLFIRRATQEGDPWSGHMALPGGRRDPSDPTLDFVARRETLEEVGVVLDPSTLLGRMNDVASPVRPSRLVVSPFVFAVQDDPALVMDFREVAACFWFGLDRLVSGEGRGTFPYVHGGRELVLPCVVLDGQRIWGMTLGIVDELIERLTINA